MSNTVQDVIKEIVKGKNSLSNELKELDEEMLKMTKVRSSIVVQIEKLDTLLEDLGLLQNMGIISKQGESKSAATVQPLALEQTAELDKKDNVLKRKSKKVFTKKELMAMKQKTMVGTMYEMLKGHELHYLTIIDELKRIGYTLNTKQPELNINSLLSRDPRFKRVGKGVYTANLDFANK